MRKNLLLSCLILISFAAIAQKTTKIKGKLLNNEDIKIVYIENILSETVIDSAKINRSGKFNFEIDFKISDFYKFRFSEELYLMYIPEPGEHAEVELDAETPDKPKISGSKNTELVYSTLDKNYEINQRIEAFKAEQEVLRKQMLREMINANPNSLAGLFFVNELDIEEDFKTYKTLSEGLSEYSDNYLVSDLAGLVQANSLLAIGTLAPEILLQTPQGDTVALSSLRGNYVLVDFWAAWCRPCREESPNMVKMYNKYHKKGFTIYSVSLDKDKGSWEKAIKDDELDKWVHVSDLMFWSSQAAQDYNVEAIPYTLLIDKEGIIIAKDLRGEDLEKKLEEIFK